MSDTATPDQPHGEEPAGQDADFGADTYVPLDWGLLDAESQNEAFPDAFPIPTRPERENLRPGDMVKLVFVLDPPPTSGPNAERMWVEVRASQPDGVIEGWLTNKPVVITSLAPGALVAFEPRHVAGIALRKEEVSFDATRKAVVSARALKLNGPPGWAGHDEPLADDDSGWTITAGDEADDYFSAEPSEVSSVLTLAELVEQFPALVEVFQSGEGEWVYRPEHRRYVRLKDT